jgi:hypothetical protein
MALGKFGWGCTCGGAGISCGGSTLPPPITATIDVASAINALLGTRSSTSANCDALPGGPAGDYQWAPVVEENTADSCTCVDPAYKYIAPNGTTYYTVSGSLYAPTGGPCTSFVREAGTFSADFFKTVAVTLDAVSTTSWYGTLQVGVLKYDATVDSDAHPTWLSGINSGYPGFYNNYIPLVCGSGGGSWSAPEVAAFTGHYIHTRTVTLYVRYTCYPPSAVSHGVLGHLSVIATEDGGSAVASPMGTHVLPNCGEVVNPSATGCGGIPIVASCSPINEGNPYPTEPFTYPAGSVFSQTWAADVTLQSPDPYTLAGTAPWQFAGPPAAASSRAATCTVAA